MKRILASFIILAVLLSFAACGKQESAEQDGTLNIQNALIYQDNGVKITSEGFTEEGDPAISLNIENSGEAGVEVSFSECVINGYMSEYILYSGEEVLFGSIGVPAGESVKAQMVFEKAALTRCGIEQIGDISLCVALTNPETYEDIAYSETVHLCVEDGVEQVYDDAGTVAYDKGGIKIVFKGFDPADKSKKTVLVYVANASETGIDISAEKVKVNGKKGQVQYTADVLPGMRSVAVMRFEDALKEIRSLETGFCINRYDYKTGEIRDVIAHSKVQSFELSK